MLINFTLKKWKGKIISLTLLAMIFSGTLANAQLITIGTGTTTNETWSFPAPYGNWNHGAKHQFIYTATELTAAGASAGFIESLGFNVMTPAGTTLQNFTIKIGTTSLSNFTTATAPFITGLTTVVGPTSYADVAGWNMHPFVANWNWDGTSNIVVEVCFNNSSWSVNGRTYYHTTTDLKTLVNRADAADVCTRLNGQNLFNSANFRPNIRFGFPIMYDLGLSVLTLPTSDCGLGTSENVQVTVTNFGLFTYNAGTKIPLKYQVNNGVIRADSILLVNDFSTNQNLNHVFSTTIDASTSGIYNVKAWVDLNNDQFRVNDTAVGSFANIPIINTFPHFEDFESNNGFWTSGGPTANLWQHGVPGQAALNNANSGTKVWQTGLNTNYPNNANARLTSPCMDFSEDIGIPAISFYLKLSTELNYDGMIIEGTNDGVNWVKLGSNTPNFYNNTSTWGVPAPPKWSGSTGWVQYFLGLREFQGEDYVRVRFVFMSDGIVDQQGVSFDDFRIFDSCQYYSQNITTGFHVPDTVYVGSPTTLNNLFSEQGANASGFARFAWLVNNNLVSSDKDLSYTFSNTGNYTVQLVTFSCAGYDTVTQVVEVMNPTRKPLANFIVDRNIVDIIEDVNFTDLSLYGATNWEWIISPDSIFDPLFGGSVPRYSWLTPSAEFEQHSSLLFDYPGIYTITLVATNAMGSDTMTISNYIVVRAQYTMCAANGATEPAGTLLDDGGRFVNYGNNVNCGFLINPCASAINISFASFNLAAGDFLRIYDGMDETAPPLWNTVVYPNGLTGTMANANFVSTLTANSGMVFVRFVTDAFTNAPGFEFSWESVPGIFASPIADFSMPDTICKGYQATLVNLSNHGDGVSFVWDIGNNGQVNSVSENFNYNFNTPGVIPVRLEVTDCGGTASIVKNIVVLQHTAVPVSDFTASNTKPNVNEIVTLYDESQNCIGTWNWTITPNTYTFVTGSSATSRNPQVRFTETGFYTITLENTNDLGTDIEVKTNFIEVIEYCIPQVITRISDLGISRVQLNTLDNSSQSGVNAYSDYTSTIGTSLEIGSQYNITISRPSNNNPISRAVWIDFNRNGIFEANELVASSTNSRTAVWTGTFSVPTSATSGPVRMRVGTTQGNFALNPCGVHQYGEFEDYLIFLMPDITAPEIILVGDTVVMEIFTSYVEPGYSAFDNVDGVITQNVIVSGNLDTANVGNYIVTYTVADATGNTTTINRVVIVEKTSQPNITLDGPSSVFVEVFNPYVEQGVTVSDVYYNASDLVVVITSNVDTTRLGNYNVQYCVTDPSGNRACVNRTVIVGDTTPPTVSLIGSNPFILEVNTHFIEPGLNIRDNYYPVDQLSISYGGTWTGASDTLGDFIREYCVTDGSGNTTCIERIIRIVDTQRPQIELVGAPVVYIKRFENWSDPGVNVYDNYDLDPQVIVDGNYINSDSSGQFYRTYVAVDQSGNKSMTVSRTIIVTSEVTSVSEINLGKLFAVYPNPTTSSFIIDLEFPVAKEAHISLINSVGQQISLIHEGIIENQKFEVNLENYAAGIYLVKVQTQNGISVKRVVLTQ